MTETEKTIIKGAYCLPGEVNSVSITSSSLESFEGDSSVSFGKAEALVFFCRNEIYLFTDKRTRIAQTSLHNYFTGCKVNGIKLSADSHHL